MQMDDMILVSIDDHMIEPPDLFENHVPGQVEGRHAQGRPERERRRRVALPGLGDLDALRHGGDGGLAP